MAFMKGVWRFLVGIKDGLALLFLLVFFGMLYALLSAGPNPGAVRDGALLIELDGFVSEQPAAIDPVGALLSQRAPMREYRQRDISRALELAVKDHRIKAVVLDLDRFMGGGQTSLAALGERIDAVRKAGKPVYAFATAYSDDGYQLAAHASEIWVDPLGGVLPTGPGGSRTYYKGLFDQLGVKAHIYRVGTFKSAVEPYMRADQSPEAEVAMKALYDEVWEQWRSDVAKARPKAKLDALLADAPAAVEAAKGDLAQLSLANGLVDKLGDRIAFGKYVAAKVGEGREEKIGSFAETRPAALLAAHSPSRDGSPIGVITVAGEIIDGKGGPGVAAGDSVSELIYDALKNDDLKALVVRVDSPGGSVTASEKIRLALAEAKKRKIPVVVSMANLAASGGYWISMPADTIFAEPSTITGSIGIFGVLPSGKEALAKWGVTTDGVRTTPLSGEPDVLGGISPEFDRLAQATIEKGYRDFLTRVAASRKKTVAQVDAIGQGRVWAGGTARQLGLVDRLGGLDDALAEAARLAKLEKGNWHPLYIEPMPDFASALLGGLMPEPAQAQAPMDLFGRAAFEQQLVFDRIAADLRLLSGVQGAQVLCLECEVVAGVPVKTSGSGSSLWLNFWALLEN
ncbi:MAG: signal peptide peptidase SppA [Sphingorhabdus sp.]|uniref:signal peptide peptidase SppA n=1 Tax=Sphingorhabdus sp. TaxID=1902408 RepID=UPI003CA12BA4